MAFPRRRFLVAFVISCVIVLYVRHGQRVQRIRDALLLSSSGSASTSKSYWAKIPERHPVTSFVQIPSGKPGSIPAIQHVFAPESDEARTVRVARQEAVKSNFTHAWQGYKTNAWMADEVGPLSGRAKSPFGGWAATLVDALDTLWIMGLHDEFEEAVQAVAQLDFSKCSLLELNVFETTIRYLGGLLAAYDLSRGAYPVLLDKAVELGEMLYKAFDTPNRMPVVRWDFQAAAAGHSQHAGERVLVAELGSLTLEFTRLTQLTNDPRYFDAVQRVMDVFDSQQEKTHLPGMWPVTVNAKKLDFTDNTIFTIGGMADSLYEYLPKQHILLGGGSGQYQRLYHRAMAPIRKHIFYRPMTQGGEDILFPGKVVSDGRISNPIIRTDSEAQHLACFAGGMVAIGSKIFNNVDDMDVARKLVEGCLWAYEVSPLGIMPEVMHTVRCKNRKNCEWNPEKWHEGVRRVHLGNKKSPEEIIEERHIPPGVIKVTDRRYILRPEAIESTFILYRITGDSSLLDRAWNMFNNIIEYTITDIAHAELDDCTIPNPPQSDSMESFWLSETLKYFYLIFSEPDLVNLDEFVFNTEAHPFRWAV